MSNNKASLSPKKRLVSKVYPVSLNIVDRMNRIPTFVDFLEAQGDVPTFATRFALYDHVSKLVGAGPIDYLEFGVHQGESIRYWAQINQAADSRFVGFDSFEGLPEQWLGLEAGHFSTGGNVPAIDDGRVSFVRGWFQETLDGFLDGFKPRNRLVINNDSDLYSSTLYTLTRLNALLVPGTIIIFDEFDDVQHEFRALQDYCSAYLKKFQMLGAFDRFSRVAFEVL